MATKKPATAAPATKPAAKAPAAAKLAAGKKAVSAKPAPASKAPGSAKTGTAKTGAAKPATQPTVSLKQVAAELAVAHDLQKKQAEAMMTGLVELMVEHLKKGDRLRLNGLGILQVRHSAARAGRNPATGEAIQIAAKKKIAFRPAKELKDELI